MTKTRRRRSRRGGTTGISLIIHENGLKFRIDLNPQMTVNKLIEKLKPNDPNNYKLYRKRWKRQNVGGLWAQYDQKLKGTDIIGTIDSFLWDNGEKKNKNNEFILKYTPRIYSEGNQTSSSNSSSASTTSVPALRTPPRIRRRPRLPARRRPGRQRRFQRAPHQRGGGANYKLLRKRRTKRGRLKKKTPPNLARIHAALNDPAQRARLLRESRRYCHLDSRGRLTGIVGVVPAHWGSGLCRYGGIMGDSRLGPPLVGGRRKIKHGGAWTDWISAPFHYNQFQTGQRYRMTLNIDGSMMRNRDVVIKARYGEDEGSALELAPNQYLIVARTEGLDNFGDGVIINLSQIIKYRQHVPDGKPKPGTPRSGYGKGGRRTRRRKSRRKTRRR